MTSAPYTTDGNNDRVTHICFLEGEVCPRCAQRGVTSALASDREYVWCMSLADCDYFVTADLFYDRQKESTDG